MSRETFGRLAWIFVAYLIAVILFGAWVRIAGAGAGCGNHWPLCNGEVVPQAPAAKTIIEFTHRLTSGLCGVFGLAFIWWAWKIDRRRLYNAALATMFFILVEAFIGAVLVKKELVANDVSMSRAVVGGLHLANTLLLVSAATAMAWWATPAPGPTVKKGRGLLAAMLIALLLTNITGAITALGDTLFPRQPALDGSLWAKLGDDISAGDHFLVRLRALHPAIAILTAGFLIGGLSALRRKCKADAATRRRLHYPILFAGTQVLLGIFNIALGAPGWMQIVHLLVAQILWVSVFVNRLALKEA